MQCPIGLVAVGPRAEIEAAWMADAVVDGSGRVLLPGLVNGHHWPAGR